MVVPSSIIDNA
jgi:methyltransferase